MKGEDTKNENASIIVSSTLFFTFYLIYSKLETAVFRLLNEETSQHQEE